MSIYFNTRGQNQEYDYNRIGWIPDISENDRILWEQFGGYYDRECPVLILKSDLNNWELLLTAVDTERADWINRPIVATLLIKGSSGDELPLRLIKRVVREISENPKRGKVSPCGSILNEAVPDSEIVAVKKLREQGDQTKLLEKQEYLSRNLEDALRRELCGSGFDNKSDPDYKNEPEQWYGDVRCKQTIDKFFKVCERLISGQTSGYAYFLPYVSYSLDDVEKTMQCCGNPRVCVVLVDNKDSEVHSVKKQNEIQKGFWEWINEGIKIIERLLRTHQPQ